MTMIHNPATGRIDIATRRRLSGPGLRTFQSIADRYDIPECDRAGLLGVKTSTQSAWVKAVETGALLVLPSDVLIRISGLLGVQRALEIMFPVESEAKIWLSGPHLAPVFGGRSPCQVMVEDGIDGIFTIRRYLDGLRVGAFTTGNGDVESVCESDLVFL